MVEVDFDKKTKDFIYFGDKNLTQHILFNLIRSSLQAIKSAEKGVIKISLAIENDYNILKFTDTALGVSQEELDGFFKKFTSKKPIGAGLSLAFCKKVMHMYGGDINCKSVMGEYIEFTLSFPKIG